MYATENLFHCESIENRAVLEIVKFIRDHCSGSVAISQSIHKAAILGKDNINDQRGTNGIITADGIMELNAIVQIHKRFYEVPSATKLAKEIQEMFPVDVSVFCNVMKADIVKKGLDKSEAITMVAGRYNDIEKILVMGDSFNDFSMIQKHNGFTIGTANEQIQKAACRVYDDVSTCILEYL